jgi:hypothetical protein
MDQVDREAESPILIGVIVSLILPVGGGKKNILDSHLLETQIMKKARIFQRTTLSLYLLTIRVFFVALASWQMRLILVESN